MSKLQKKPAAHKRGHPTLHKQELKKKFLLFWVIFALLDPDPLARLNPDPIPIRIQNPGCGSALVSMRIRIHFFYLNADPDPGSQTNADLVPEPGQT